MAWEPTWTNGQLATSPCGGSNCLCWSTARAVQRDSKGAIAAVTGDIRRWISSTTCGGTTLAQNVAAAKALYGVELTIRYSLPWADFLTLIEAGRGAAVYIGYAAMHGSGFDSFPTFNGGHGVYVGELSPDRARVLVYDPGADGRYSGIPKGPQWWPLELLKKAAGAMPAGSGTVGYGFVSAAFTRDTEENEMGLIDIQRGTTFPVIAAIGAKALRTAPSDSAPVFVQLVDPPTNRLGYVGNVPGTDWRIVAYAEPVGPGTKYPDLTGSPVLTGAYIKQADIWKFEPAPAPVSGDVAAALAKGYGDAKAKAIAALEAL